MKASNILTVLLAVFAAAVVNGCSDKAPGPVASLGSVTIGSYVSVGNSLTAGYQSNGWYESSQKYSYPNLIAQQLNASGASINFVQPLWSDPGTPIAGTNIASRYEIIALVGPNGKPVIRPAGLPAGAPENLTYAAPYNNLAVPGAFIYDFLNATNGSNCYSALGGSPNALFTSTLRTLGTQFTQAALLKPDLITFWLGNNDVLGYATTGGTIPVTSPAVFGGLYSVSLDSIRARIGSRTILVVANIPDVTAIPFFTTIPSQGLVLTQAQADGLNTATGGAFHFAAGLNGFLGATGTGGVKKLTVNDYVLLTCPQDSLVLAGWGSLKPIPNQYVLDSVEAAAARSTVVAYNTAIAGLAASHNAVLVDINALLSRIAVYGVSYGGQQLTAAYVIGGIFSLDGVHPTSKGQGLLANEFIRMINQKLGSTIPSVDIGSLPGIPTPLSKYQIGGKQVPYYSADALKALQLQWF